MKILIVEDDILARSLLSKSSMKASRQGRCGAYLSKPLARMKLTGQIKKAGLIP